MRPQDFDEMRPADYEAVIRQHTEAENNRLKFYGDMTRMQTAFVINLLSKKKIKKLADFWPMPWDEEKQIDLKEITPGERQRQIEQLLKKANDGKQ